MNDPTPVADAQGTALDLDFGFRFEDLYDSQALRRLDRAFLEFLGAGDAALRDRDAVKDRQGAGFDRGRKRGRFEKLPDLAVGPPVGMSVAVFVGMSVLMRMAMPMRMRM